MEDKVLCQILEQLRETNTSIQVIQQDLAEIKTDIVELKADVSELKTDVSELKTDVTELKIDVTELKADVSELKTDVTELKADVAQLKVGQANLDNKLDVVFKQTAHHMEFETETRAALADIKNELIYITHKEVQNEKELIQIKSHLKIIK